MSSRWAMWAAEEEARKRWEKENPEAAAVWNAALEEDEQREHAAMLRWATKAGDEEHVRSFSLLTKVGVPVRVIEALQSEERAATKQFAESLSMAKAREFVEQGKSFLLLFGGVGAGKTCAACWTLTRARKIGVWRQDTETRYDVPAGVDYDGCFFIRAAEASRIPRFNDNGKWDGLLRVPRLVVDDLGVETVHDYWGERVNELLDARYGNKLKTALTSNLSVEEFRKRYGERIISRIRDDGVVAGCGSEDFRSKKS